jgi:hypothetical protein
MADGSLPAGEAKAKFKATLPFEAAVPEDKARESGPACPKDTRANSRDATATVNAIRLRVEEFFIGSHISSISPVIEGKSL